MSGPAAKLSYSSPCNYESFFRVKIFLRNNRFNDTRRPSFVCSANSGGPQRNPDFSRQNRQGHGFSRNKNRHNLEREDNLENLEDSDFLASKNGPLVSPSGSQRFQATSTPGPKEKEIVELFRKVQAQLRERAAIKEEKKIEASQGDRGTVDSLLDLLRKHSSEQGKKTKRSSSEVFNPERHARTNNPFDDEQNTNYYDSNNILSDEVQEQSSPFSRPTSNFRRKSPVPRVKYESAYSTDEIVAPVPSLESQGKRKKNVIQPDPEPISSDLQDDFEDDVEDDVKYVKGYNELSESSDDENTEPPLMNNVDLNSMKLSELKDLAKSRGLKGYSKLKKSALVELLGGSLS